MIQEPFVTGNSPIHFLDPRIRLIFAAVFAFTVALSSAFQTQLTAFFVSIILVGLARLNIFVVFKRIAAANGLILFLWIIIPVTYPGTPAVDIGPLHATMEGIMLSARITIKSNAILLAVISLIATIPISTLGHSLHRIKVHDKIIYLFLLTYRYIFVIGEEYHRLMKAARIRSFYPKTSLHTYKTFAYLIGMIFVRATERAERVNKAMICRGFNGTFHSLHEFSRSKLDYIGAAIMIIIISGLEVLEWIVII